METILPDGINIIGHLVDFVIRQLLQGYPTGAFVTGASYQQQATVHVPFGSIKGYPTPNSIRRQVAFLPLEEVYQHLPSYGNPCRKKHGCG